MNKRARNRLVGVTAIIVISVVAIFVSVGGGDVAYSRTVGDVVDNAELVGERVKVTGTVIPGSWDGKSSPMRFDIRDPETDDGPMISVVYNGGVPSTFGDDVVAIVTGVVNGDGVIESVDMITQCPSKYEAVEDALSVSELLAQGDGVIGRSVRVTGYVVDGSIQPPGGDVRFSIADETGSPVIDVHYPDAGLPDGMEPGSQVVLGGLLDAEGVFEAISVALAQ